MNQLKYIALISLLSLYLQTIFAQLGPGGVGYADDSEEGQPELVLWLKADQLLLSDGAEVDLWEDQSGNENNAESGGQPHPIFLKNGIHNMPAVYFDGNTWYKVPENTNLDGGPGISIFVIIQPQAVDQGGGMKMIAKRNHWNLWGAGLSKETCEYSFNLDFHGRDEDQYIMAHVNGNLPDNKVETEAIYGDTSKALLVNYNYTGEYSAVRVNGINNSGNKPNPNFTVADLGNLEDYDNDATIAAAKYQPPQEGENPIGDFLNGKIAEIALYRTGLDSTQLQIVENYFAAKYNMDIGEDMIFSDTICKNNLIAIGSKNATDYHREAGNGILTIIEKNESLDEALEYVICADDGAEIELVTDKINESWDNRWSRIWKIEKQGEVDTEFWFNFSEAGIPMSKLKEYGLLYTDDLNKDFVTVFDNGRPRFGNLNFTLENDGLLNGYYTIAERESSTGLNTFSPGDFEVYPNPFQDYLKIRIDNPGLSAEIKILDLTGRTIKDFGEIRFSGNTYFLKDLQIIGKGYFILNIRTDSYQANIPVIKNTE